MSSANEKSNPLHPLLGEELSAVVFVRDYVQLQFDGPGLTLINDPTVITNATKYQPALPGYRDALCERIGKSVSNAQVAEGDELRIDFNDGSTILISLRPGDYIGAEAAIFNHGEETWVW